MSEEDTVPEIRALLAEAESGVPGVPVVVQPAPAQHHLVSVLAEARGVETEVVAVPHDVLPSEDLLPSVELAKDVDAHLLDGEEVGQPELVGERVMRNKILVEHGARDEARLLVVVEPFLHARLKVILGGTRALHAQKLVREPARVGPTGKDHE